MHTSGDMNTNRSRRTNAHKQILEAAGEVFAKVGYHNATVRMICARAHVNVAAVNYHFGSKDKLYETVCRYSLDLSLNKYSPTLGLPAASTPRERLRTFIRSFLFSILDKGKPAWHELLVAREMLSPTRVLDILVETTIKPRSRLLFSIVRDLLGNGVPEASIRLCCFSIIGQCLHYRNAQSVIRRLNPALKFDSAGIEEISEHIVRFSLAALKQVKLDSRGKKP